MENNKIKLYKYVSNINFLKDSYCKQEIWLTPINALNDPFEGHAKTKQFSPKFIEKNPEIFDMIYKKVQKKHENLTREEFKQSIHEPSFNAGLVKFESKIRRLFNEHGITSFTLDPKNIPMWTYYANNHQGYCLEFEIDFNIIQEATCMPVGKTGELIKDILNNDFVLSFYLHDFDFVFSKVKYSDHVPIINYEEFYKLPTDYKKIEYITKNSIGVKFEQWKHEKEFRLIANSNSIKSGCLPLKNYAPFLKFTGVIIGASMPKNYINKIIGLHEKYKFNLQKAMFSGTSFDISIVNFNA